MNDLEKKIKQTFKDKDYRHGYVDEFLNTYIATQIKVLREQQGWSQTELGEHAGGMKQARISVLENVNYSSWSIKILRKLAEAFDLTLCVSFESFGKRVKDIETFSREFLERNSFDKDPYFLKEDKTGDAISDAIQYKEIMTLEASGKAMNLNDDNILEDISSTPDTIFTQTSAVTLLAA